MLNGIAEDARRHSGERTVTDLTDPDQRKHFGIALETLTGYAEDDLESCRIVADIARLGGYDAMLSPSAALDVGQNLNLYIDGRADHCDSWMDRIEFR